MIKPFNNSPLVLSLLRTFNPDASDDGEDRGAGGFNPLAIIKKAKRNIKDLVRRLFQSILGNITGSGADDDYDSIDSRNDDNNRRLNIQTGVRQPASGAKQPGAASDDQRARFAGAFCFGDQPEGLGGQRRL